MTGPAPPLSRPVKVDRLPKGGQHVRIAAGADQLAAIAADLGLPRIESLSAAVEIRPLSGRRYAVAGEVKARIWQTCVVTLEDFATEVAAPIETTFAEPDALPPPSRQEVERSLADEDPPDPVENGVIDAGALAVEFLALALEPFPRKPGAALPEADQPAPRESPFAALAALKGLKT